MGSGKSTVGRIVARRLGWPFVDTDVVIEARTGSTVRELWERGGEAAFRALERDVVVETLAGPQSTVLAAPGGVVVDPAAAEALHQPDVAVVWLKADPATLARRVRPDDHRPLLGADPAPVLARLNHARQPMYRALADVVIDVDRTDPESVATEIVTALTPEGGGQVDLRPPASVRLDGQSNSASS